MTAYVMPTGYQPFDSRALCALNKYVRMHSLCPLHVPRSCLLYGSTQDKPRIAPSGWPADIKAVSFQSLGEHCMASMHL